MLQRAPQLYTKVAEGIWIGNEASIMNVNMLMTNNITAIINLTGTDIENLFGPDQWYDYIDVMDFLLPNQELMDTEIPKVTSKLDAIIAEIYKWREEGKGILILCFDGKNKSMLVAAYYTIVDQKKRAAAGGPPAQNVDDVISHFETIYYTPTQKQEEREDNAAWNIDPDLIDSNLMKLTVDERKILEQKREARRDIRGLTISTFRKLLRLKK